MIGMPFGTNAIIPPHYIFMYACVLWLYRHWCRERLCTQH